MTALVIGAPGLVGAALMRVLSADGDAATGTYHSRPRPALIPLDVTDSTGVERTVEQKRPDAVFLAGALTAVDYCEEHVAEAWRINVAGTRNVARAAAGIGAKLVLYSTEYVFDGTAGPYAEDDPVCPQGVYAWTKAAGEEIVRAASEDHLILRTTVVYGWDPGSKNFAMQVWHRLSTRERMRVPGDQIGNPTLVEFLAETSVRLVHGGVRGTVNVVGRDRVPRTAFAVRLAQRLGLDPDLIEPVATRDLMQRAPRPLDAGLKTEKLAALLGTPAIGLDDALDRFVARQQADLARLTG
jgi:dTDP-4-dehydrorhamnose reductase